MRVKRPMLSIAVVVTGTVGMLVGMTSTPGSAAPAPQYSVIASGFDNPRGLAVGAGGQLYVAEAGKGGPKCIVAGPEGHVCPGLTGAISVIGEGGAHHRIATGLLSVSDQGGFFATGPDGLSRNPDGQLYTIITACPQQVDSLPPGSFSHSLVAALRAQAGQVERISSGHFTPVAGVGSADWTWSKKHSNLVPGQFPDCDPYGILAGHRNQWVVDAASNTLDFVRSDGSVHVVAFFPNPPSSDAVPTCVDRGPDGALYVGELTGGGNKPGASIVWRVDTSQAHPKPTVWARGVTAVTGCGFANGAFYAVEFSTKGLDNAAPGTGDIVRVPAHSTKPTVVASGLSFPNGFAAAGHSVYVSNWSISPAQIPPGSPPFLPGEVVKVAI
jgi:hypothetical protein